MYDSDGNELYREHQSEDLRGDSSLISVFNTLYSGLEEVDFIPDDVLELPSVISEIIMRESKHTLICYFSMTEGSSYCTDANGYTYKIRTADSERFLRSRFSEILYREASLPILTGGDGSQIAPSDISWNYQNIEGTYVSADLVSPHTRGDIYGMAGEISLSFNIAPTATSAQVFDNGIRIFEGTVDELHTLILSSDSSVNIKIFAQWEYSPTLPYYGVLEYDFSVSVHTRAEFSLSTDRLSDGEFAILTATNITDISKLSFYINGNMIALEILLENETAYALIPYALTNESSSISELTVSYGVSSYKFSLNTAHNPDMPYADELKSAANTVGLLPKNLKNIKCSYPFLFADTAYPDSAVYQKSKSFGQAYAIEEQECICFFTEYQSTVFGGSAVCALTPGLVCEVGENNIIGKYVVVDLGLGLHLTYFNLSFADVRVGSCLAVNDCLGKCGALAQNGSEGFSIMLSCGDAILDAEKILTN